MVQGWFRQALGLTSRNEPQQWRLLRIPGDGSPDSPALIISPVGGCSHSAPGPFLWEWGVSRKVSLGGHHYSTNSSPPLVRVVQQPLTLNPKPLNESGHMSRGPPISTVL